LTPTSTKAELATQWDIKGFLAILLHLSATDQYLIFTLEKSIQHLEQQQVITLDWHRDTEEAASLA